MGVLKLMAVFAASLVCASAQRPFYASSAQYPPVLPQNLPNNTDGLGNRFGENSSPNPNAMNPVYNVDQETVDRVKEFPRDKQPFWYLNAAHLNTFKNPQYPQQPQQVQPQQAQSQQAQQQQQQQQQEQRRLLQQQRQLRINDEMLRRQEDLLRRQQQRIK